ncbi:MAG: phosphoenolpyruvate-utilizing N-terminal domain-containing protein, partial [Endozoicomonas sp.]
MLNTLRTIVQEVSAASDLQMALEIIVQRVRDAMKTEVCSVYLFDPENSTYALMASEGLKPEAIGQVTLAHSEGLVGQVGLRAEPINLEDAESHPKFHYIQETGEERLTSFLGVPIIHNRNPLGVMVVQQVEQRRFDEHEEAFLVTMSAQLAGVIAHAQAIGSITNVTTTTSSTTKTKKKKIARFKGSAGATGVAIGHAVVISPPADLGSVPDRDSKDLELELKLLDDALVAVRAEMEDTAARLAGRLPEEERALFDVYQRMLDDRALGQEIRDRIRSGSWAQGALRQVIEEHVRNFEMMDDHYLRERAADVRDLGRRVLAHLQQGEHARIEYPESTILISEELSPVMLGEVPQDLLAGLISIRGSGNSHVAILARALGVPTVMGVVDLPFH